MSNSTPPSNPEPPRSGGINVDGGAVSAGRDIAGRDIVNVSPGFSARVVIALISVVGMIVFFTTACSLVTGIVVGGAAFGAFDRKVGSSETAARSMEAKLNALDRLPAGQRFTLTFSEDEISSYVRFIAGPRFGLQDARVRLLDKPGQFVLRGNWTGVGNLPIIAVFQLTGENPPLKLEQAAVKILPLGDSFGWILVTPLAQPLADRTNDLFGRATFNQVRLDTNGDQRGWTVTGIAR